VSRGTSLARAAFRHAAGRWRAHLASCPRCDRSARSSRGPGPCKHGAPLYLACESARRELAGQKRLGSQPPARSGHLVVMTRARPGPGQAGAVRGGGEPAAWPALPGVVAAAAAADADAVVAFVIRQDDLGSAEQAVAAARADRLAWIGYPKGG
jgi:hypothetical protein